MTASVDYIRNEPWTDLFQVSPSQFNVSCELEKEEFLQLNIINGCDGCIAWKLKTNRPGRYMVSPKQGVINGRQHQQCTVVLAKLKAMPDTSKPDKFLIQATKIDGDANKDDLSQLWKERESKHDKKRNIHAYQAVTIKCFLSVAKQSVSSDATKPSDSLNIIDNYVCESDHGSASKSVMNATVDSTAKSEAPSEAHSVALTAEPMQNYMDSLKSCAVDSTAKSEAPSEAHSVALTAEPMQNYMDSIKSCDEKDSTASASNRTAVVTDTASKATSDNAAINITSSSAPTAAADSTYDAKTIEQWKRKALEYDELFQFTRKTLAQRDELNTRWKAEREKYRTLQKVNEELTEEKKHLLREYNEFRNDMKRNLETQDNDADDDKDNGLEDAAAAASETEEKCDTLPSETRQARADEIMREMQEIDKKAEQNSKIGFVVSLPHLLILLVLVYIAFQVGAWYGAPTEAMHDNKHTDL
eukprot:CAMPEP_0202727200 /NCGR_PEP_ID=MMETSP1385-20130828/185003_1 /ASSEMBLY_ACC=CAM_ASM_000861 /TAXON_ID=933848 /ORGANISM="Elphidium margaritaceum" /LENGTH=472 /DNA_ID=CAMNT_0049393439 /DNA_START=12 /DNA_END=1430 /DNA_ORIENTATION=-